jgi:putative exporter of polyketide antibiotics
MAGALIGAAYAVRAAGDMGDNALSWLSPIGWAQATAAYVDNNWWPLGLAAAVTAALIVAAFALSDRRDIGAACGPAVAARPPRNPCWARRPGSPGACNARACSGGASPCSPSG